MEDRQQRLTEFLRRLQNAPLVSSFDEALAQLATVLNQVEDEMSGTPYRPELWQTDGRMYPPQDDSIRRVPDHPHVRRLRTRKHNIYIADNGAMEIQLASEGTAVLTKAGLDGKEVWQR